MLTVGSRDELVVCLPDDPVHDHQRGRALELVPDGRRSQSLPLGVPVDHVRQQPRHRCGGHAVEAAQRPSDAVGQLVEAAELLDDVLPRLLAAQSANVALGVVDVLGRPVRPLVEVEQQDVLAEAPGLLVFELGEALLLTGRAGAVPPGHDADVHLA
jgi:hypothetical protein